jgi:hypothetical protein
LKDGDKVFDTMEITHENAGKPLGNIAEKHPSHNEAEKEWIGWVPEGSSVVATHFPQSITADVAGFIFIFVCMGSNLAFFSAFADLPVFVFAGLPWTVKSVGMLAAGKKQQNGECNHCHGQILLFFVFHRPS